MQGGRSRVIYFRFPPLFGAACDSALPAARFELRPVRPSRSTLLAAFAAPLEVLRCFAICG